MTIPSGTVTFLFTDIEGSTRLAREHPEIWEALRLRHHEILRKAFVNNNGFVFQIIGDAFCASFHNAVDALKAAVDAQQSLQNEPWGETVVRVRMGIHTGEAETDGSDYRGYLTLSLVQRLMSAGSGGQVLVSGVTENLLRGRLPGEVHLLDLGRHMFKDVSQPVRVFQASVPGLPGEFPPIRTIDHHPTNLPAQLTSFVGREKELADVKELLQHAHMLSLLGPGGTGKTRLSIQAAAEMLQDYPDGAWLVELAPIMDPLLVPRAAAVTLGLRDEPQRPIVDMLCDFLHDKKMLILLDNCEHLVEASARLADQILHAAPDVRVLASSREALGIAGEVTYRVPSLGLPDRDALPPLEAMTQYEAVRLFIDRATSAVQSFAVTNESAPYLAQICHRLDGIPLAIELAAAKVRVLSIEQIARRLDDRFKLLTGGSRTAFERHQTLRAAIDWSYNLLPSAEQVLFQRVSVFVDGWTLEAAESVCSAEPVEAGDILDLMDQLINKSLVIKEEVRNKSRYRMLETIRQYAGEKLFESGEGDTLRGQHLAYFQDLAEAAEPHLRRARQIEWLDRLDAENENLRAALVWALTLPTAEATLRLAGALGAFWELRSYWLEGATWLDQALARDWDPASPLEKQARARVLFWKAKFGNSLDKLDVMKASAESAIQLYEELKDRSGAAYARAVLANYLWRKAELQTSKELFEQCLEEFHRLGDAWGESYVRSRLKVVAASMGDLAGLLEREQEALDWARRSGDRERIATALVGISYELLYLGRIDGMENHLREADQLFREVDSSKGVNMVRGLRCEHLLADGRYSEAKENLRSYIEYFRQVGDSNLVARGFLTLGLIEEMEGNPGGAVERVQKAVNLWKEIGSPEIVPLALAILARLSYRHGERAMSARYVRETLELIKTISLGGDSASDIFCQIGGMLAETNPSIALQLLGFSEIYWQAESMPGDPIFYQPYFERFLAEARKGLDEKECSSARQAGLNLTLDQASDLALKAVENL